MLDKSFYTNDDPFEFGVNIAKSKSLVLQLPYPGCSKENFNISVVNFQDVPFLEIRAKNPTMFEDYEDGASYGHCGIKTPKVLHLEIPSDYDIKKIDVTAKDGILTVTIPPKEKPQAETIKIVVH